MTFQQVLTRIAGAAEKARCRVVTRLNGLRSEVVGGTAILMALAAPAVIGGLALSVDMGIWYLEKRKLQQISDMASIGALRVLKSGGSVSTVQRAALGDAKRNGFILDASATFIVNTPPQFGSYAGNNAAVEVIVSRKLPLFFSSYFIKSAGIISARSVAYDSRLQTKHLEVALMLDVSLSMLDKSEIPGMLKLQAMQDAAKARIDVVVQTEQQPYSSRVALIPYSSSVNVGEAYFSKVTNKTLASTGGDTSVVERAGSSAFTEDAPEPGKYFPDYKTVNKSALGTFSVESVVKDPKKSVINPLSANKTELINTIDNFKASGTTAGHIGIAWSWYVMSPKWAHVWNADNAPQGYDSDQTLKIAVLMSDFNMNTAYQAENGDALTQAKALCARLKAGGITVYTVGYNVPAGNPDAVALWKGCASSPDTVYSAKTVPELISAFEIIARTAVGGVSTTGPALVE